MKQLRVEMKRLSLIVWEDEVDLVSVRQYGAIEMYPQNTLQLQIGPIQLVMAENVCERIIALLEQQLQESKIERAQNVQQAT